MKRIFLTFCFCLFVGIISTYSWTIYRNKVFTLHPDGKPVTLYEDWELTTKRVDIYPKPIDRGYVLCIDGQFGDALRVRGENGPLYAPGGVLGVKTRNYDQALLCLYAEPDRDALIVLKTHQVQTVPIYGAYEGWLYVEATADDGQRAKGWLAPEMQCGRPNGICP